jgi:putative redox protein
VSITRAVVVGDTQGPAYRQDIRVDGHALVADEPLLLGGADAGPTPSGYLLAALGSCTSITLRIYAEKKGWSIGTVTVTLDLLPKTDRMQIRRAVALSGPLSEAQRLRLAEVCERTPVTLVVKNGVRVDTTVLLTAAAR